MPRQQSTNPRIKWEDNQWSVTLPLEDGRVVNATWKPGVTYVVRIREAGAEVWSFGFKTPITSFTFIDLKPDTEYELQVPRQERRRRGRARILQHTHRPHGGRRQRDPLPGALTGRHCHVWTPPVLQGENRFETAVELAVMYRPFRCGTLTAGPDGIREIGAQSD